MSEDKIEGNRYEGLQLAGRVLGTIGLILVIYVFLLPIPCIWYFETDFYTNSPAWLDTIVEVPLIPLEWLYEAVPTYENYLDWIDDLFFS